MKSPASAARVAGGAACLAFAIGACTADEGAVPSRSLAGANLDVPGAEDAPKDSSSSSTPSSSTSSSSTSSSSSGDPSDGGSNADAGAEQDTPPTCPAGKWCSALYPPGWTPNAPADAEGRFLYDFSYAGYHSGEAPPSSPPGSTYDVVAQYGADPSGTADATAAIQAAIDAAGSAGGGVVFLPSGTYSVGGMLSVTKSGVVLRGVGKASYLRFTKATGLGGNRANLTFTGAVSRDGARPLVVDGDERANEVVVADATGIAPGDHVAIGWTITDAFTADHHMTGTWTAFANSYQVFFRAKVTAVANGHVTLDVPLRYRARMRDGAALQKETGYLTEVGLEHVAVSNATSMNNAWAENQAHVLAFKGVRDAWMDDVHSVAESTAAPYHLRSGGVYIENSKRVSVLRSSMENAQNRGGGGNGYLFEVSRTNDVLIADTEARNGRHNFIQNWGFGNVGTVFLRCVSSGSMETTSSSPSSGNAAFNETHHSLAMATLVDDSRLDDGFVFRNRVEQSDGAGQTATESVVWRASGTGRVVSKQFGWGYVIGSKKGVRVDTTMDPTFAAGTAPQDVVEGADQGDTLYPASLYEHQRARRLAPKSKW